MLLTTFLLLFRFKEAEGLLAMAMDTYVTDKPCSEFLLAFNNTPSEFDFTKFTEHFKAEYGHLFK